MAIATLIFELVLLAVLRYSGMTDIPSAFATVLILLFSIAYLGSLNNKKHINDVIGPLLVGYCFRIFLLFFDIYCNNIFTLPNSGFDSKGFYVYAVQFAKGILGIRSGFSYVMGNVFKYFGNSRLYGQFLLTLCSVVSLETAAKSMSLFDIDVKSKKYAMWILCLLPNFAILSSIFLRESVVAMFLSLSLYQYLSWIKKKRGCHFIFAIALTFCAAYFHSGSLAVAVGYLLSRLLYDNKSGKLKLSAKNVVSTVILVAIAFFVMNRYGENFLEKFANLGSLEDIANESTEGASSYARYVGNSSSLISMLIFTLPRIFFFLFSPLPWMIRGISDLIAFCFSSCFYILVLYKTIKYLMSGKRKNREIIIMLLIIIVVTAFVFGWGTSNAGTACRHRDKMTAIWAVLLGLVSQPDNRRTVYNVEPYRQTRRILKHD